MDAESMIEQFKASLKAARDGVMNDDGKIENGNRGATGNKALLDECIKKSLNKNNGGKK